MSGRREGSSGSVLEVVKWRWWWSSGAAGCGSVLMAALVGREAWRAQRNGGGRMQWETVTVSEGRRWKRKGPGGELRRAVGGLAEMRLLWWQRSGRRALPQWQRM